MESNIENLWQALLPLLNAFTQRIAGSDPKVICNIGRFSTDASLLYGYASMFKSAQGDVVEVTFDISPRHGMLALNADASTDDGEILAHGPHTLVHPGALLSLKEGPLAQWIALFKRFLMSVEPTMKECVAEL